MSPLPCTKGHWSGAARLHDNDNCCYDAGHFSCHGSLHRMTASAKSPLVFATYLAMVLLGAAALWFFWSVQARPLVLRDSATGTHKLQCASYSPFDKDQSPLVPFTISAERVDADLALLARYFTCVRTYSVTGFDDVPPMAQKHGLKLMLGAWVSADAAATRLEIEKLISTANQYPDVVQSVVIGNEALLRKEISGQQLAELITEVKGRVQQPVTYADVWEFWLKHPQVAPVVDFITIHLLPYWEDDPAGIDDAIEHVADVRERFGRLVAPKDIFIGETGWPSAGRQRETAVPSRANQARFMRGFIARAEHSGWTYNLIEAFDQPWKRQNEGAVGGYWGLFDADRQDKNILAGPVIDVPDWRRWLAVSGAIALGVLVLAGRPRNAVAAVGAAGQAVLGGACLALWWKLGLQDNRDGWEWGWTVLLTLLNVLVMARGALACSLAPTLGAAGGWRAALAERLEARAGALLLAVSFIAATMALQLMLDARYREFPSYVLLLPAIVFGCWPLAAGRLVAGRLVAGRQRAAAPRRELTLLAAIIAVCAPLVLWQEKLTNTQALGWVLVTLALAFSLWRSIRTMRSAASSAANTASVTV
jgi:exo-beta-1,3-glucanase (GH17 family)